MADYDDIVPPGIDEATWQLLRAQAQATAQANAQYLYAQNSNRSSARPLSPAETDARQEAHDEMQRLLANYEETGAAPRYEIRGPEPGGFFVDDVLIERGATIEFYRIPNEQMEPLNTPARQIMALYLRSIGGSTPDLADQSYEAYHNRPREAHIVGGRSDPPPLGTPRGANPTVRVIGDDGEAEADMPGVTPGQVRRSAASHDRPRDPVTQRYMPMAARGA